MSAKKALFQSPEASSFVLLRIDGNRLALDNNRTAEQRRGPTYAFSNKHSATSG